MTTRRRPSEMSLHCRLSAIIFLAGLTVSPLAAASGADSITEEEAHSIGVDAYVYFYPLLSMDITRKQLTNVEAKKGAIGGPPNLFNNILEFPPADLKVVVRPNFDTLYSSAWLDDARRHRYQ